MIVHLHSGPLPPERVMILGASGFLGRGLADRLRDEAVDVLPLSSSDVDLTVPKAVPRLMDLARPGDAVVFASAITPDRERDVTAMMQNLLMGQHVAALVQSFSFAQMIYLSSDAVYADDESPIHEESSCDPPTLYGLMHRTRERMLDLACGAQRTPFLVVRPVAVYGPGDTHNSYGPNRFLRAVHRDGKITLFGAGEERRDHVFIDDVSEILWQCLAHRSTGSLNLATGRAVSFSDVAGAIADLPGLSVDIETVERSGPVSHRHFDVSCLVRAFPSFRFTALRDGLAASAAESDRG